MRIMAIGNGSMFRRLAILLRFNDKETDRELGNGIPFGVDVFEALELWRMEVLQCNVILSS